jgi:ribonuclease P protein component
MPGSASPTFNKRERIVSRTLIEKLFSKGSSQSTSAFPLRVVYMQEERKEGACSSNSCHIRRNKGIG